MWWTQLNFCKQKWNSNPPPPSLTLQFAFSHHAFRVTRFKSQYEMLGGTKFIGGRSSFLSQKQTTRTETDATLGDAEREHRPNTVQIQATIWRWRERYETILHTPLTPKSSQHQSSFVKTPLLKNKKVPRCGIPSCFRARSQGCLEARGALKSVGFIIPGSARAFFSYSQLYASLLA